MAKQINIDDQLAEPIELIIDGKLYRVGTITADVMTEVAKISEEDSNDPSLLRRQLGLLLSVDPEEFKGTDIRKLGRALKTLTEEVGGSIQAKNV